MKLFQTLIDKTGLVRLSGHTFFRELLTENPVVLDCGSHQGAFICGFAKMIGAIGKGICIEANPSLVKNLVATVPQACVVVHAAIVGDEKLRTIELNLSNNPEASSIHEKVADSFGIDNKATVPCTTLEQMGKLHGLNSIDLWKLDVEGAENDVVQNASLSILEVICQVSIEFHDIFDPNSRPLVEQTRLFLRKNGFVELNANWPFTDDILFVNERFKSTQSMGFRVRLFVANLLFRFRGFWFQRLRR